METIKKSEVMSVAMKLAQADAQQFKVELKVRSIEWIISRAIDEQAIAERISDPVELERVIKHRRKSLRRQLSQVIKSNTKDLMTRKIDQLAHEFAKQMECELGEYQSHLNLSSESKPKLATVRNCFRVSKWIDGDPFGEFIKSETMTVTEFNQAVSDKRLIGYKGNGVVFGLLDAMDYSLDSFVDDKVEVDAGEG